MNAIADQSLHDHIASQTQQLAGFKNHMEGLMQQHFPSLAEGEK